MAIGLGALASGYTGAWSDFYRMMIEQELQRRNQANQYDLSYQNWQKQQQYLQQQNAPLLQRQQAWQQLQEFERTYPQQQILAMPHLQAQWQQLRTQAGVPLATQQVPGAQPLTLGGFGAPSEAIRAQAGRTVQIPTGQMVQQPILPQLPSAQPQTVAVLNRQTGKVQYVQVPAGARIEAFTPPAGEKPPDPSLLTSTERQLLTIWLDPTQRGQIGNEATQQALWARLQAALRRIGIAVPEAPPPPTNSGFWDSLRQWWQDATSGAQAQPRNVTAGVPQPQPAVGTPPVSPGQPAQPARAVGAPPAIPQKTITQAQVAAIAKKKGVPLAEAIRQAKAQGYVVVP